MKRPRVLLLVLALLCGIPASSSPRPKLVVVISLDQFRYEYLTRFGTYFGPDGFQYLMRNGANLTNATYKHAHTSTGPGHTVILTGAYGNMNGIVANTWYDRTTGKDVYCVRDLSCHVVGGSGEGSSPANIMVSTLGDELKLHDAFRPKVISLSSKDRAAIPLGGKFADLALWMIDSAFVTSSYYRERLPSWVEAFNASSLVSSYFGRLWEKCLPESAYAIMDVDDASYEDGSDGLGRVFPHPIVGGNAAQITPSYYEALFSSPYGNEILIALAQRAVVAEKLGKREVTDLLCINLPSNDYVGHRFGPHSQEVLDISIRSDRLLADFFKFLDREIGLGDCLIVLTSDHGVGPVAGYLRTHAPLSMRAFSSQQPLKDYCEVALTNAFGALHGSGSWIARMISRGIYLNPAALAEKNISADLAAGALADSMLTRPEIIAAYSRSQMMALAAQSPVEFRMRNSFYPKRSGDVVYCFPPYYHEKGEWVGASHGSPYEYDAHVLLLIAGEGIQHGTYATEASPADIAPTLATLLGVEFPSGRAGRVLVEILKPQ
jgi:predicted AlkP superfamily pyrophosphatase or phosphodiesterase